MGDKLYGEEQITLWLTDVKRRVKFDYGEEGLKSLRILAERLFKK